MGRPPALTPAQQKEATRRRAEGATLDELARSYNVGKSTIRRTIVALIWFRLASRTEEKYKQSRTAGDGPPWRDPCARSAE